MANLEYLGRSLNQRSYDAVQAFNRASNRVMAEANAHGRLMSGYTLVQLELAAVEVFSEYAKDSAQFTFNAMGTTEGEVATQLNYCLGRMVELIMQDAAEAISRLVAPGSLGVDHVNKLRTQLNEKKQRIVDDFTHGMLGSNRLKLDPVVNLIANQVNSPGAVQQVGAGEFSQSAFSQEHQHLVATVKRALASAEFSSLSPEQKDAFQDMADAVVDEAKKEKPDPGKLKRWGTRLSEFATQVGMRVASGEILEVLARIFAS